jgi:hypothetical protein
MLVALLGSQLFSQCVNWSHFWRHSLFGLLKPSWWCRAGNQELSVLSYLALWDEFIMSHSPCWTASHPNLRLPVCVVMTAYPLDTLGLFMMFVWEWSIGLPCTLSLLSLRSVLGILWDVQVQGKQVLNPKSCPLRPLPLTALSKSLTFHVSSTLQEPLQIGTYMHTWFLLEWKGNLFLSLSHAYYCPQTVSHCLVMKSWLTQDMISVHVVH